MTRLAAGLGARAAATAESVARLLDAAGPVDRLAVLPRAAALISPIAAARGAELVVISEDALRGRATPTQSERVAARFGVGSIAEALALEAAGPGAVIVAPRQISADRLATLAVARGRTP